MSKEKIVGQLKRLTEMRGPVPKELRDYVAAQNKAQQAIIKALKEGPKSVPEIAAASGLTPERALWHLSGLRKYGKVADVPGRGDYPKYSLKSGEAK
jgi:predicted Rossmann fold nucleotide-binding protein DprA/Smf involved in DNA uptake